MQLTYFLIAAGLCLACGPQGALHAQDEAEGAAEAQEKWYSRRRERADLVPGAFEVLRFPIGYQFKPRYRHDPKNRKRITNPDFHCNQCVREGRIPATDRARSRIMERNEEQVLSWIEKRLRQRRYVLIEDDTFKLYFDLEPVNLKEFRNPFLAEELEELGDVFPEVSAKTVVIDGHRRAHLYLIRAHRLLRDFWWMTGTTNSGVRTTYPYLGPHMGMWGKQEVFVFAKRRAFIGFCDEYIGRISNDGQCWHHFRDRAMLMAMTADGCKDPEATNFYLHRLAHNFADAYRMYAFKLPAWFQMGLGHWVERRESTRWNSFCYSEGTMPEVLTATDWLPRVKKLVGRDRVMPFVEAVSKAEYGDFPMEYHMIAYSWFCYMLRLGPEKLKVWLNAVKGKDKDEPIYQAQVRAFREAYGINFIQFDEGWRRWVAEVYPDL